MESVEGRVDVSAKCSPLPCRAVFRMGRLFIEKIERVISLELPWTEIIMMIAITLIHSNVKIDKTARRVENRRLEKVKVEILTS